MQSIHESVFIAPGVQLYGDIAIGRGSSLWPNMVIRAEANPVRVGRYTNLQDFVMVHIGYDDPTTIGDFCTIAHHTTIHGCTIEDHCLIGVNAVVMDGAVIGAGSIVAGGAMVPAGKVFPASSIIAGVPAKRIKERDSARANRLNAWLYHRNAAAYKLGDHHAWQGESYQQWLEEIRAKVDTDADLVELGD